MAVASSGALQHLTCVICKKSSEDEAWGRVKVKRNARDQIVYQSPCGEWCLSCKTTAGIGFPLMSPDDIASLCATQPPFKLVFFKARTCL